MSEQASTTYPMLRVCGWCEQILVGEDWLDPRRAMDALGISIERHDPLITHGICPDCAAAVEADASGLD